MALKRQESDAPKVEECTAKAEHRWSSLVPENDRKSGSKNNTYSMF